MKIAVASGKGGTGKSTLSVSLALMLERYKAQKIELDTSITLGEDLVSPQKNVYLLDADVEEPNAAILLHPDLDGEKLITLPLPVIDRQKCDFCGKCKDFCSFNAMVVLEKLKVFAVAEMCKGCKGCALVCPHNAITFKERRIGVVSQGSKAGLQFLEGRLDIGQSFATPLISKLKAMIPENVDVIIDAPPGAAHPMVEAVRDSDYLILITEPTLFGLHDLKEAIIVADELKLKRGVVINRADIGDSGLRAFLKEQSIEILAEFPFDRAVGEAYSRGIPPVEISEVWREGVTEIIKQVSNLI